MTTLLSTSRSAAAQLAAHFRGEIVTPDHPGYDGARRVWNGAVDRYPALVARCTGAGDVAAALRVAREAGLVVAVRGGGHSIPGHSTCDGGMLIDLQPMKAISVDPAARTATAEPGVLWGELDAATQAHGLATTGGEVSDTGIAGLTLGGGIGWLKRTHGLTCDNLLGVEVVTADGRLVRADAGEHPDLFWAVRGGGGNFGIVTAFRYALHEVGPLVGGLVMHPIDRGGDALRLYRDLSATVPDDVSLMAAVVTAPPAPFVPSELQGRPVVLLGVAHFGRSAAGEAAVAAVRGEGSPAVDLVGPISYVALQQLADPANPRGMHSYLKSEMLGELTDAAIDALLSAGAAPSSPMNQILLHQMGGEMARVAPGATAFVHRDAAHMATVVGMWAGPGAPDEEAAHVTWTRSVWAALAPLSTGGAYVNHLGTEGQDRVRQAYGDAVYGRLARAKAAWDPDNVFRLNQNIAPAAG